MQNINLMHKILQYYQIKDFQFQNNKNTEIRQLHQRFCKSLQKQSQKISQQSQQLTNLKQIIELLIQKLRIRRKQVRKLLRQTKQLLSIINQFKDKNIQLEMKYLNQIESSGSIRQIKIKQIQQRKVKLNKLFNQILIFQHKFQKNSKYLQQEVNLQGPLQAQDYIKQATTIMYGSKVTNEQVKAEFDVIFDKYQQDFQEVLFRLNSVKKNKSMNKLQNLPQTDSINFDFTKNYSTNTQSTQTTFSDKFHTSMIKSIGVNVIQDKKLYSRANQVQTSYFRLKRFKICRTIDLLIGHKKQSKKQKRKNNNDPNSNCSSQDEQLSQSSSSSQEPVIIRKKRRSQKFHNIGSNKNIKSRFSLFEKSPHKIKALRRKKFGMGEIEQQGSHGIQKIIKKQNKRSESVTILNKSRFNSIDQNSQSQHTNSQKSLRNSTKSNALNQKSLSHHNSNLQLKMKRTSIQMDLNLHKNNINNKNINLKKNSRSITNSQHNKNKQLENELKIQNVNSTQRYLRKNKTILIKIIQNYSTYKKSHNNTYYKISLSSFIPQNIPILKNLKYPLTSYRFDDNNIRQHSPRIDIQKNDNFHSTSSTSQR